MMYSILNTGVGGDEVGPGAEHPRPGLRQLPLRRARSADSQLHL